MNLSQVLGKAILMNLSQVLGKAIFPILLQKVYSYRFIENIISNLKTL